MADRANGRGMHCCIALFSQIARIVTLRTRVVKCAGRSYKNFFARAMVKLCRLFRSNEWSLSKFIANFEGSIFTKIGI